MQNPTVIDLLIPLYIGLLLVLIGFTGLQWRAQPTRSTRAAFLIFAASMATLLVQGAVAPDDALGVCLTSATTVWPLMAIAELAASLGLPRVSLARWSGLAVVGAAVSAGLAAAGLPFELYAYPMVFGTALPALPTAVAGLRRWAQADLPERGLTVTLLGWVLNWHSFPFLRMDPDGATIGFGMSLALVLLAGLIAPAIAHAEAVRATEREREARQRLAADAAAIADYLAKLAHELRNPLNAILGYAELMREELADAAPDTAMGADLDRVHRAAAHLVSLVDDVLDLSKVQAGRLELDLVSTDVATLLDDVRVTTEPLVTANGSRLLVQSAQDATGAIDARRVRQCLINLVANAAKFTTEGEVTVRFEGAGDRWRFEVVDTGVGMAPDTLQRLFQPFEQADARVQHTVGGTGLGLALTRELARRMGGDVEVRSMLGEGSTFTLWLQPGHR